MTMRKEVMYEEVAMVLASNLEVVKEVCTVASLDVENLFAVDDEDAVIKFCADVVKASEGLTDNEEVKEMLENIKDALDIEDLREIYDNGTIETIDFYKELEQAIDFYAELEQEEF